MLVRLQSRNQKYGMGADPGNQVIHQLGRFGSGDVNVWCF
jgi:hypothetical protein